jgi:hypothetical protein
MARRCRSASATTIGAGASVAQVKRLLDQFNGSLDHPLDDDEINTTVASIAQTHLRNHPGAAIRIAPSLPPSGPPPGNYPFPDDLLSPPGLLGEVTRYIVASALKPQPILALGAAITALGTVIGRKVRTTTDLRTNIYAVSVADCGAGKEHTRKAIRCFCTPPMPSSAASTILADARRSYTNGTFTSHACPRPVREPSPPTPPL